MCTFNLAIDDNLVENARVIFQNEDMMIGWKLKFLIFLAKSPIQKKRQFVSLEDIMC